MPFEFNREFSFILALHTGDGDERIDSFVFPKAFSILLEIPENFNDTGEILKKDSLALSRYANGVFTLSTKNTSLNFQLNSDAHKLVIVYERNFFTVFADTDHALVHAQFGELDNDYSPMATNSTQPLGLKLYTYDISSIPPEYHDYYYTIEHFLNNTTPTKVYTPEWENQTSLFGSKVGFNSATAVLTSDATVYEEAEANFLAQNPDWNIEDTINFFNTKNPVSIEELIRRWRVLVAEDSVTGFNRSQYIQQCLAEACGYDNYDDFIVGQNQDFDWNNDFIYALSRNEIDIYSLTPGSFDRKEVFAHRQALEQKLCCFVGDNQLRRLGQRKIRSPNHNHNVDIQRKKQCQSGVYGLK